MGLSVRIPNHPSPTADPAHSGRRGYIHCSDIVVSFEYVLQLIASTIRAPCLAGFGLGAFRASLHSCWSLKMLN